MRKKIINILAHLFLIICLVEMVDRMTVTHTSKVRKLVSELEIAMLRYMKKLVNEEYRSFSFRDFLNFRLDNKSYSMKYGTIRNKFSQFAKDKLIELSYVDTIAFYTLSGKKFDKD